VSIKVELESKKPLKSIYSPSHSVEVKRHGSNRAIAGYEASEIQPDSDFALYFAQEKDEIGVNLLTYRTRGEEGYFLLLASPGLEVKEKQVVLKDVAFVLDTSGSMAGEKLKQAKKRCNSVWKTLMTATGLRSSGSQPRSNRSSINWSRQLKKIAGGRGFHRELKPMGGTAIDDALRRALALRHLKVEDADKRYLHEKGIEGSTAPSSLFF